MVWFLFCCKVVAACEGCLGVNCMSTQEKWNLIQKTPLEVRASIKLYFHTWQLLGIYIVDDLPPSPLTETVHLHHDYVSSIATPALVWSSSPFHLREGADYTRLWSASVIS